MQERRRRVRRRIPAWMEIAVFGALALFFFSLGWGILWAMFAPLPTISNWENRKVAESTKIYDRTGNIILYDVHGTMRRTAVQFDEISPYIRDATVAIEDDTFYEHKGFRPLSFLRAILANVVSRSFAQGGSTITQQVVKNTLLTQRKTIARKLEEIVLSIRLERVYTKDQILNTYLNETSYGGTIYGVQEASQYFFGVDAKDVDLPQAAYLAALPQAPTRYSPYGSHRDLLDARQKLVLQKMFENGFITESDYQDAVKKEVVFNNEQEVGTKALHFVFYVREYLEEKYGADLVSNGGLQVVTTLDYDLQKKAEDVVATDVPEMEKNFDASNTGVVAIDPKTGQILAMVGSRGYFDPEIDGRVNIALAHRQPGSSFKPFVYATAFEKGYTPETVVFDLKTQFSTACQPTDLMNDEPPCYSPNNFDGNFKGPITLRNALAQSVNIPAVKTLYLAGITESIKTASDMGITTLADAARYGLTLVLGGGEVTLLEMTGAYSVFANDGVRNPPTGVLRVEDAQGNILESFEEKSARVLNPQVAREINDVLSDNVARTPEFGADSPLQFSEAIVADKTGTTNDYRDVWILGYTPGVAVGAWAGNNDNTPMQKKIAAFIIAPMWHKIMAYAIEKYPSDSFIPPAPETDANIPSVLAGNWNTDPSQGTHEILYWLNKGNPRDGRPANPSSDSQFAYWEYPVQLWVQGGGATRLGIPSVPVPGSPSSNASADSNEFHITSPQSGTSVSSFQPITLSAYYPRPEEVYRIAYFLNGGYVGASIQSPNYTISVVPQGRGPSMLRVVAETTHGNEERTISFTIQ